ncbi:MAG: hypothetical protein DMG27_23740, partial [Acidobacteria bacterium]
RPRLAGPVAAVQPACIGSPKSSSDMTPFLTAQTTNATFEANHLIVARDLYAKGTAEGRG